MQNTSQKQEKVPLKSLMVAPETHSRVMERIFKRQAELNTVVTVQDFISELLDQTEKKDLQKVS